MKLTIILSRKIFNCWKRKEDDNISCEIESVKSHSEILMICHLKDLTNIELIKFVESRFSLGSPQNSVSSFAFTYL